MLGVRLLMAGLLGVVGLSVVPQPAGSTGGEAREGRRLFMAVCKHCHGADGRGRGTMTLNPPAADLTSAEVQGKLDSSLFKSIHDGRKNTAMGAWKHALSDEEIHEVLAYVRTLGEAGRPKP